MRSQHGLTRRRRAPSKRDKGGTARGRRSLALRAGRQRSGTSALKLLTGPDLDEPGRAHGYFRLPISTDESAYGSILIPAVTYRNGDGPRVLVVAGNHGDEYEGQILIRKLIRTLELDDVSGQITLLPAANAPAVQAGRRVSPLDQGTLTRLFPGHPSGTPTQMIAHLLETVLLPGFDFVLDLHSGGSSLEYLPSTVIVRPDDPGQLQAQIELLHVFGLPASFVTDAPTGGGGSLAGACARAGGIPCLSTELGGGGGVSERALAMARHGVLRLFRHLGVVRRDLSDQPPEKTSIYYRVPPSQFLYAPEAGIFEAYVKVGDRVEAGQAAGAIHRTDAPWEDATVVKIQHDGILLCRRFPARTECGDCLVVVGRQWPDAMA